MVPLLVSEPVTAVEQLLAGQPVIGYVTGLPADQKVRHDVPVTLSSPSVFVFHRIRFNSMQAWKQRPRTFFLRLCVALLLSLLTVVLLLRAAGKIPFVCLSIYLSKVHRKCPYTFSGRYVSQR